ncbi:MAG: GNAT family N-acetyltransferase [Halolamina sp.]
MTSGPALPNVGPGPDPFSLSELEADFAVLLLHRDFYCGECRQQVRRVKSRYEEFEDRDAEVVSVLPEDRDTAEEWQKQYHLPFPVVADADKQLGARFDQPTRYGLFGRLHDIIGRMPATVVLDLRWSDPMETYAHRGDATTDRPRIDDLLSALDSAAGLGADATAAEREAAARATSDDTPPVAADDSTAEAGAAAGSRAETGTAGGSAAPSTNRSARADSGGTAASDTAAGATGDATTPDETPSAPETGDAVETDGPVERRGTVETTEADEPADSEDTAQIDTVGDAAEEDSRDVPPVTVPDRVDLPDAIELRRATEDDAMPVIRVLHGALLEIDGETVRRAVARDDVIVAEADGWIVGALVLEDNHIDTLAVRREFRTQGIGSALVETAVADIGGPVTADFRAGVRGFWQDLGFEIEAEDDRFYGIRSGE